MSYAIDRAVIQLMKEHGFNSSTTFSSKKRAGYFITKILHGIQQRSAEIRAGGYKIHFAESKDSKAPAKIWYQNLIDFTEKSKNEKICVTECRHVY